jgi:hypothetical protein
MYIVFLVFSKMKEHTRNKLMSPIVAALRQLYKCLLACMYVLLGMPTALAALALLCLFLAVSGTVL